MVRKKHYLWVSTKEYISWTEKFEKQFKTPSRGVWMHILRLDGIENCRGSYNWFAQDVKKVRHLRKEMLTDGAHKASPVSDPTLANLLRDKTGMGYAPLLIEE